MRPVHIFFVKVLTSLISDFFHCDSNLPKKVSNHYFEYLHTLRLSKGKVLRAVISITDLAPFFGDWNQSENPSAIELPLGNC